MQFYDFIKGSGVPSVFSAYDLLSYGARNTVDQNLIRLYQAGLIQKISTGLYCFPKKHKFLGTIIPKIDDILQGYARKFNCVLQVSPAHAAHQLGLTQQIPNKLIYLTNLQSKTLNFAGQKIYLKQAGPKKLIGIGTKAGLIIQALYFFGKLGCGNDIRRQVKSLMTHKDRKDLKALVSMVPTWMQPILIDLAHGH